MPPPANFRSIKADLLARIQGGEWPPGGRLPDEIALAGSYGVARTTVARAMRELVDDGLIERRRRAGTRVRTAPVRQARFEIPLVRDEITELGAAYRYQLLGSAITGAPTWVAARMGLPAGAPVRHVLCLHFADDAPYQFEDRWVSLDSVPDAARADFETSGPNEWLVSKLPFSNVEIDFLAIMADPAQARHLDCDAGAALFCIERRTEWEGRSLTFVRLAYRPGHRMTTRY